MVSKTELLVDSNTRDQFLNSFGLGQYTENRLPDTRFLPEDALDKIEQIIEDIARIDKSELSLHLVAACLYEDWDGDIDQIHKYELKINRLLKKEYGHDYERMERNYGFYSIFLPVLEEDVLKGNFFEACDKYNWRFPRAGVNDNASAQWHDIANDRKVPLHLNEKITPEDAVCAALVDTWITLTPISPNDRLRGQKYQTSIEVTFNINDSEYGELVIDFLEQRFNLGFNGCLRRTHNTDQDHYGTSSLLVRKFLDEFTPVIKEKIVEHEDPAVGKAYASAVLSARGNLKKNPPEVGGKATLYLCDGLKVLRPTIEPCLENLGYEFTWRQRGREHDSRFYFPNSSLERLIVDGLIRNPRLIRKYNQLGNRSYNTKFTSLI